MDPSRLLTQTITVRTQASASAFGDETFSTSTTIPARVQAGRDRSAEAISHTHVVYTATELHVTDKVWFPGDDTSDDTAARRPVSVASSPLPDGSAVLWKTLF